VQLDSAIPSGWHDFFISLDADDPSEVAMAAGMAAGVCGDFSFAFPGPVAQAFRPIAVELEGRLAKLGG
jgi:hypothetical protein